MIVTIEKIIICQTVIVEPTICDYYSWYNTIDPIKMENHDCLNENENEKFLEQTFQYDSSWEVLNVADLSDI